MMSLRAFCAGLALVGVAATVSGNFNRMYARTHPRTINRLAYQIKKKKKSQKKIKDKK